MRLWTNRHAFVTRDRGAPDMAGVRPPDMSLLGGALFGDPFEAGADRFGVVAEIVEAWQRGQRLEREDALEERRRSIADCTADAVVATGLRDQPALEQPGDGRVRGDTADPRDLGTG